MAFIIFFFFFLKKFEKVEKTSNYLHKIFVTMYSICYTRCILPIYILFKIIAIDPFFYCLIKRSYRISFMKYEYFYQPF